MIKTVEDLIRELDELPLTARIKVESRFKTGYDEGDTYHNDIKSISEWEGEFLINLENHKPVGGW